jgi:lysophospholipase L1-like esterase
MRSTTFFAILIVAVAVGVLIVGRRHGEPPRPQATGTVSMLGDSLNVGVEPYLGEALGKGWTLVTDDKVGRRSDEGIAVLEAARLKLGGHVVVSLGTNDPATAVAGFRDDVRRVLQLLGPRRCVVWATIWRDGAPNDAFNDVLRQAASSNHRLHLVEWADMVQRHPRWLAPDGLHGSELGYRERARAVVDAVRDCAPEQVLEPA